MKRPNKEAPVHKKEILIPVVQHPLQAPPPQSNHPPTHLCLPVLPVLPLWIVHLHYGTTLLLALRQTQVTAQHAISEQEVGKGPADWVPGAPDPDGLHHARVPELVHDHLWGEGVRNLRNVGLDATHKVRVGLSQRGHERVERFLCGGEGEEKVLGQSMRKITWHMGDHAVMVHPPHHNHVGITW